MNVLIVCHAGEKLGLGHLSRSLAIAHALHQELNANVHLLIQGSPIQHGDLNDFEHRFIGLEVNLLDSLNQWVGKTNARVVVFDLYPHLVPENVDQLLSGLRARACKLIAVDALVKHRQHLDLVFIPSFLFSPSEGLSGDAPILFGWDCFLLNVKFKPSEWKIGKRVLALTGGSDATGLGQHWPTLLSEALPSDTDLHWVIGPYAQAPVWPAFPKFPIVGHQSPSSLDDLMVHTHYAVTVYGVSFFELLYYGVPTIVFSPYGNKDDVELSAVAEAGVAVVARDEVEAVAKLKELMRDDTLAVALSQRARQKMSVLGGHKFAQAVAALMA